MGVLIDFGAVLASLHVCLMADQQELIMIAVACLAVALWFLFESIMTIINVGFGSEQG